MSYFRYMLKSYKSWRRGKRYPAELQIDPFPDGTVQLRLSLECADVQVMLSADDAYRVALAAQLARLHSTR